MMPNKGFDVLRVINPEAGECHISSEMWQRDFKKSLLSNVIRLETGECFRSPDLKQEKIKIFS